LIPPHSNNGNMRRHRIFPLFPPDYYFEHKVDVIIVIAPGYANEIKKIIKERYGNLIVYSLSAGRLSK
jgi:hypothetical protein